MYTFFLSFFFLLLNVSRIFLIFFIVLFFYIFLSSSLLILFRAFFFYSSYCFCCFYNSNIPISFDYFLFSSGTQIDWLTIREILHMLSSLEMYSTLFEPSFLSSSEHKYRLEAAQAIHEMEVCQTFIRVPSFKSIVL